MPNRTLELLAESKRKREYAESSWCHPRVKDRELAEAEELLQQAIDMVELRIFDELKADITCEFRHEPRCVWVAVTDGQWERFLIEVTVCCDSLRPFFQSVSRSYMRQAHIPGTRQPYSKEAVLAEAKRLREMKQDD